MQPLYPLTFDLRALTRDYLWGGSKLKALVPDYPTDQPLAEIWLVSDRPEENRVGTIVNGPLTGTTLRQLMETRPNDLLGDVTPVDGKFPLLIKFLDAKERLSLQVHPPENKASELGGDPKTECWTFLDGTNADVTLVAGLKTGASREQFEQILSSAGDLTPLLHAIHPKPGDCLFLPSGRLHGLGAGCLVYEVQQNSNTTYRVFDWNRVDRRTGQPRELHVAKALASIDFADVAPTFQILKRTDARETLVDCPYFTLERWTTNQVQTFHPRETGSFEVITVVEGEASVTGQDETVQLERLSTSLIPAAVMEYQVVPSGRVQFLRTFVRT